VDGAAIGFGRMQVAVGGGGGDAKSVHKNALLQDAMGNIQECIFLHKPSKYNVMQLLALCPPSGSNPCNEYDNMTSKEIAKIVGNQLETGKMVLCMCVRWRAAKKAVQQR
jgi:hypothetical protein